MVLPALAVGIFSAVLLYVVISVAGWVEDLLWDTVPGAVGLSGTPVWTLLVLTLSGVATGLIVWKVPGHAGPDPATMGLVEAPLPLAVVPSLLLALMLTLSTGVSLGPENPIMAIDIGLVVVLGTRFMPKAGLPAWIGLSTAGMIAAMFGTPVAAALVLSEAPGDPRQSLWDRLFAPLVAAGAGALTTDLLAGGRLGPAVPVGAYPAPQLVDLFTGGVIAGLAALIGLVATYLFRQTHPILHRLPNPLIMLTVGGVVLGVLGIVGGPITLFKGLDQSKELVDNASQYSAGQLALIAAIKVLALVIAATAGFRGGRIFPSLFIGVALGLFATALVPAIPASLAVACAVLGIVMAVTRQGWLSLFMGAAVIPNIALLPILTLITLPVWLVVSGQPPMQIVKPELSAEKAEPPAAVSS
jgi:H+/Cl- antiporter ClcA